MSLGTTSALGRLGRRIVGDSAARSLLPVQALHSAGEALFALSLVGSLFFNVSVDAARGRILLYLALTMAPFLVLAPLLGPIIDRVSGGHRWVLLTANASRAVLALVLATQLKTLGLYPLAFLIVVMAKVHLIARNALVPSIVKELERLVLVNSRLARTGAVAGVVGGLIGAGLLGVASAPVVLWAAAVAYGLAALASLAVPPPRESVAETPEVVEITEMHGRGIGQAAIAMGGLRFATGFVFFHVGFSLKTSGQPVWVMALVGGGAALGGFIGTFVAPRLRRHIDQQEMLTVSLVLVLLCLIVSALRFHGGTSVILAFGLGVAGSVGRRAFDGVVQTEAPHARRGQAYAWLETRLEISWVAGSLLAVVIRADDWLGLVILGVGMGLMVAQRTGDVMQFRRSSSGADPATVPFRLLTTAEQLLATGDGPQALVVAQRAFELAVESGSAEARPDLMPLFDTANAGEHAVVARIVEKVRGAMSPSTPNPPSEPAISAARPAPRARFGRSAGSAP